MTDIAQNKRLAGAIRRVKVHGTNYEPQEGKKRKKARSSAIDLISDDLFYEEQILTYGENRRTLDDNSAYSKLDDAYAAHRDTLESASHIE